MKKSNLLMCICIIVSLVFAFGAYAADKHEGCKGGMCPVCKAKVDKAKTQFKSEYNGRVYYFATDKCKAEFDKNPENFAKNCSYKIDYVCPMKECKVTSDKPGKCPKCGMELKKTEAESCCVKDAKGCCSAKKEGCCSAKKDGACSMKKEGGCSMKKDSACSAKKETSCAAKKDAACAAKKEGCCSEKK